MPINTYLGIPPTSQVHYSQTIRATVSILSTCIQILQMYMNTEWILSPWPLTLTLASLTSVEIFVCVCKVLGQVLSIWGMLFVFFRENNPNCKLFKLLFLSRNNQLKSSLALVEHHRCKELVDWLQWFNRNPRSLKDLCRVRIRASLGDLVLHRVKSLPLPTTLKDFITLKEVMWSKKIWNK